MQQGETHTHTRARRHKISIVKFLTHFLPLSPESKSYNPDMLQATRIRAEHPPLFHFFSLSISLFSMRARPSKLSLNPGQLQCGQEECTVRLGRKERGGVGWVAVLIMYSLCAYNMCGIYVLYIRVHRTYYILKHLNAPQFFYCFNYTCTHNPTHTRTPLHDRTDLFL